MKKLPGFLSDNNSIIFSISRTSEDSFKIHVIFSQFSLLISKFLIFWYQYLALHTYNQITFVTFSKFSRSA